MKVRKLFASVAAGVVIGSAGTAAAVATHSDKPKPYVVSIQGSAGDGWKIRWSNGAVQHTPTRSEDLTLCKEDPYAEEVGEVEVAKCMGRYSAAHTWRGILKRTLRNQ
jgi:hypothetical protein